MASTEKKDVAYIVSAELIKVLESMYCICMPFTFSKVASLLPSNKKRSLVVHGLVKSLGLLEPNFSVTRKAQTYTPRRATRQDLATYHTPSYLDFVLNPLNSSARDGGGSDVQIYPELEALKIEYGLEDVCYGFSDSNAFSKVLMSPARIVLRFLGYLITCSSLLAQHSRL